MPGKATLASTGSYPGGRETPGGLLLLYGNSCYTMNFFDSSKFILATTVHETGDDSGGLRPTEVVGLAVWQRRGTSDAARSRQGVSVVKSKYKVPIIPQSVYVLCYAQWHSVYAFPISAFQLMELFIATRTKEMLYLHQDDLYVFAFPVEEVNFYK
jgi:hypothetical protein